MKNLNQAIFLEAAYSAGRFYDMSSDSIRPQADFVPREAFYRFYDFGFIPGPNGGLNIDCRAWIWR